MPLPSHLFVSEADGALHDTREPDWSSHPLRPNYARHHRHIRSLADLKATLRAGPYAWPGGYPLYFVTADGAPLSFETVKAEWRMMCHSRLSPSWGLSGWRVVGCEANYEDELYDDHSGARIESAYGE